MGDGEKIQLAIPADVNDGRILIPAIAFAESFGAKVNWDESTLTLNIEMDDSFEAQQ